MMDKFTIKSVEKIREERRAYWKSVHTTAKHIPATKKLLSIFWQRTRNADPLVWDDFTKYSDGSKWPKISGPIIKTAFRQYIAKQVGSFCCYCCKPLANTAAAKPIEHILPRETYPQFALHFWNLAVACVDCNSEKKTQVWFKVDPNRRNYPSADLFVDAFHPRFHIYDEHVQYLSVSDNTGVIDFYVGHTTIGKKLSSEFLSYVVAKRVSMMNRPALASDVDALQQYSTNAEKVGAKEVAEFSSMLHRTLRDMIPT